MIAIARLNRPSVFVYGGTILPGFAQSDKEKCNPMDIVSVFEAVGKHAKGALDDEGLKDVEKSAIPVRVPAEVCTPQTLWLVRLKL